MIPDFLTFRRCFLAVALLLSGIQIRAQEVFDLREILVWTREGVVAKDLQNGLYAIQGLPTVKDIRQVGIALPVFKITLNQPDQFGETLERLKNSPMVESAGYNGHIDLRRVPDDPKYSQQWALKQIKAPQAWDLNVGVSTADHPVVIAVLDAGFERGHEDLKDQIWRNKAEVPHDGIDNDNNGYIDDYYGYNTLYNNDSLYAHFHGTKVAGIIGASGDNGKGISGINWDVEIMTVSFGQSEDIQDDDILEGMEYILRQREAYNASGGQKGAYVVAMNMSLGRAGKVSTFKGICRMMDRLGEAGILTVGASANTDKDVDIEGDLPCDCGSEYLICVTSTDQQDRKLEGAAYGKKSVDLGAPGKGILSTTHSTEAKYSTGSGTSFATPMVSGAVGLIYNTPCDPLQNMLKKNPGDASILVRDLIFSGVDKVSDLKDITFTGGRLNLYKTLSIVKDAYCDSESQMLQIKSIDPNPAQKILRLRYSVAQYTLHTVRVVGIGGNILFEKTFWPDLSKDKSILLDVSSLAVGNYVLQLFNDYEQVSKKFQVRP